MVDISRTSNAKPSVGMLVQACRPQANRGPRPRWLKMMWVIDITLFLLMQTTFSSVEFANNEYKLISQSASDYVWSFLFSMGLWWALRTGWEAARIVKIAISGLTAFAVWMPTGYDLMDLMLPESRHPLESLLRYGFVVFSLFWIFLLARRETIEFTKGVSSNSQ